MTIAIDGHGAGDKPGARGGEIAEHRAMVMFVASDALATFVGKAPLSRSDVFDKIWAYIEASGLFSKNQLTFKPDRKLTTLLGLGARSSVSRFELPALVNKQLRRATAPTPRSRAAKAAKANTKLSAPAHTRTKDELLGVAVDFDGAQIFLVTDLENARAWRGTANGKGDAAAGSDWAAGFAALHGHPPDEDDADEAAAPVAARTAKPSVDVVAFGDAGWLHVFGGVPRLVLIDGTYDDEHEVRSRAGSRESLPTQADFAKYVASPPAPRAERLHSIQITSGWLLLMSATAQFAKLKVKKGASLTRLDGVDVVQVDDDLGGRALLVRMPKGLYDLFAEPERKGKWGSAQRLLVAPA